jgi:hypothetical protein
MRIPMKSPRRSEMISSLRDDVAHRSDMMPPGVDTSPISKLRAVDDERRQVKRNSLADGLAVEAKSLAT